MNKRAREIIFQIMERRDYQEAYTVNDLMDKFKISERTIRHDPEGVTDPLLEGKQKPIQLCEHGVIELQGDTDAVHMLLEQNDFYPFKLSKEERIHMILCLIANTGEHVTLQQLADISFISRSTIIHDVDNVRKNIQKQNLEVVSLRRGLRIQGRESNRRVMLTHLLRLPYVQQYRISEYKDVVSPRDLESLRRMIKDVEILSSRFLIDGSFEGLRQYLMLMIERYHKYRFVGIDHVSQHLSAQKMASHLMNKVEDYFGMEHRLQEEHLLTDILYNIHYLKRNDADEEIMRIQVISKQFIDAVARDLNIDLRNDFQSYRNLTNHLQSIFKDLGMGYDSDNELLYEVVKRNLEVTAAIGKNLQPLELFIQRIITHEEVTYITIHVCAAIGRNRYQGAQFTTLLACNSDVGTSQLLLSRLKKHFQFYVADVLPMHALAGYDVTEIDLIISMVPLKKECCGTIILHPCLSNEGCILLGEKLETLKSGMYRVNSDPNFQRFQTLVASSIAINPPNKDEIYKNITRDLQSHFFPIASNNKAALRELLIGHIEISMRCTDWKGAVRKNAQPLLEQDYLSEQYTMQMIRSIKTMGSYIVLARGFALSHELPDIGGGKLGMQLVRLKHPIPFHSQFYDPVDFVCCLFTIDKNPHLKAMLCLMNLSSKAGFCENIGKAKATEEVYQIIYEYESIL